MLIDVFPVPVNNGLFDRFFVFFVHGDVPFLLDKINRLSTLPVAHPSEYCVPLWLRAEAGFALAGLYLVLSYHILSE